jgi:acyl carrier protein
MTGSQETEIEQRVRNAITRALRVGAADPSFQLRMGSTPGWDSMGHMMVVMEIEKEFATSFPPYRLPELVDISSIAKALQNS